MMDCKNALTETDGDFDKAVELLRIKGAKDVGKRAERTTAEGLVAARDGVMIELNAETDFVAKNAEFQELADKVVAAAAAAKPADLEGLKAVDVDGKTVETLVRSCPPRSARSSSCVATSRSTALSRPTCTSVRRTCPGRRRARRVHRRGRGCGRGCSRCCDAGRRAQGQVRHP